MATGLSQFDKPNIPELVLKDDKTLSNHMLESVLGVFGGEKNSHVRHLVTNLVRRTFAAIETYRLGRIHALDYVNGHRHVHITPYFRSLTFFETCIGYCWQATELVYSFPGPEKAFVKGDSSCWERLHGLYTVGTKHSYGKYDQALHKEMPTTIWLTNDGIECIAGAKLTFIELTEIIAANNDLFYDIQKSARNRFQSKQETVRG